MPRDYDEYAWHFRVLADAQQEGRLVFVLGSGVGRPYGLPDWSQLLAELLLDSGRLPRFTERPEYGDETTGDNTTAKKEQQAVAAFLQVLAPDPLIQGAIAHTSYPGERWRDAIDAKLGTERLRQIMRERGVTVGDSDEFSLAHIEPSAPLVRIARMLTNSIKRHPSRHLSIITFNYDSLLDDAVRQELKVNNLDPAVLRSVSSGEAFERTWLDAGIYIYHLHGYLPHRKRRDEHASNQTVLDADSYLPVLRGDHWSWRCMERALTGTGHASLFIGLSIADPSLRYVLTRWGQWQTPMTGVYLAPPPWLPAFAYTAADGKTQTHHVDDARTLALIYRAIMDLYSAVLDRLHLVCYYLSSWNEISDILEQVENPK